MNRYSGTPSNMSRLYLAFHDDRVQYRAIRHLYDLNGIVAAVGGSLGLFLGFSCADCFSAVVDLAATKRAKKLVSTHC